VNEHHYLRIDAGKERRPKGSKDVPSQIPQPAVGALSIPLEDRHRLLGQALKAHAQGNSLRTIAEHIGVTHGTIRRWLLSEVPQEYKSAQEAGLIARIVDVDEELELAEDPLSIARAREAARFARWDAERRLPHLFGPKQEVTHTIKPEFNVILKSEPVEEIVDNNLTVLESPHNPDIP
jgi:transcriptional regulator with XRE-family HTH domain